MKSEQERQRFPFVVAMDAYDAVEPVAESNLEQEAVVNLGRRTEDLTLGTRRGVRRVV